MQRINKLAWKIRRKAATKYNCKVMTINWGRCYNKAKNTIEKRQGKAIRLTAKRYVKRLDITNTVTNDTDSFTTRTLIQGFLLIPFVVCCIAGMVL